jgi:hypothetical protein
LSQQAAGPVTRARKNVLLRLNLGRLNDFTSFNRFQLRARLQMRSLRFESETSQLFRAEDSLEPARIKNVIELSVLRRGSGA